MGPKILLAKPGGSADEDTAAQRSRVPWMGSLNFLSDSLPSDFQYDRFLPFLTENTDFTVVGVMGPPGVGKSSIMNHLYAFDASSPGMLPAYATGSEDIRAASRHLSVGIEPRVSSDRLILLDTQPVSSPSILAEMIRPDGSSPVPLLGDSLSAELAHEIMNIQVGVFLMSVCHVVLVVSDDLSMWRLMSTVDLVKHGIPDPSTVLSQASREYMAAPIFVHTKLRDHNSEQLRNMATGYFRDSSFRNEAVERSFSSDSDSDSPGPNLFVLPRKTKDECQSESYASMLDKLRDRVLSMSRPSFSRTVSEREWLRNSAKIWDLVKNSPVITEYTKALQSSSLFRR